MKKTVFLIFITLIQLKFNASSQSLSFRLSYKYTFVPDSTKPSQQKTDIMHLDITTDSGSTYYSKDVYEKKVLFKKDETIFNAMIKSGVVESSKLQKYKSTGVDDIVIKNYQSQNLIFATWAGLHFYYVEPLKEITWEYSNATDSINGFFCQKANCTLFGRKYEAWFCKEIQLNDGPWKFSGLPGAIVKVSDINNYFKYELFDVTQINVEKVNLKIDVKEYKETTKIKLQQLMKEYFEDKMGTMQRLGGFSIGTQNKTKQAPKYYNPQELNLH